jgi:hypothetical protein
VGNALELDATMDPKKAECVGFYLYGSGYYAREDQQAAILMGKRHDSTFCMECPVLQRCVEKHRERTRDTMPDEWSAYTEQVRKARRRGISETLVEAVLQRAGHPSPLMTVALRNYKQGVEHKRRVTGTPLRRATTGGSK